MLVREGTYAVLTTLFLSFFAAPPPFFGLLCRGNKVWRLSCVSAKMSRWIGDFCVDIEEFGRSRSFGGDGEATIVGRCRGTSLSRFYSTLLPALQRATEGIAEGQFMEECCVCFEKVSNVTATSHRVATIRTAMIAPSCLTCTPIALG